MSAPEADPLAGWLDAWLRLGLPYDEFWLRTPREAERIARAAAERLRDAQEWTRAANHELARLVAFAFHEPKKLPEYKPVPVRAAAVAPVSDAADQAYVRGYLMSLAMRGKS